MAIFGSRKKEEDRAGKEAGPKSGEKGAAAPSGATPKPPSARPSQAGARSPLDETVEMKRSESSATTAKKARKREDGAKPTTEGVVVATIGKSIIFKGELTGDEDLEIDGNVEGDIKLPSHVLTVGPHGRVKAEITAKCVQVVGHVAGNVNATERVEVEATGIVEGDISAPRLLVQEGAVVNGAIKMTKAEGGAAKPSPSATPTSSAPGAPGQPARKAG
jgi:cytoskeletal protein CcmA (bactofilin family)